jgi:hypothetical protein
MSMMTKRNISTIVIWVLSVALVGATSLLLFVSMNSGVSLDNARQAQGSYREEASVLRSLLLDVASLNQEDALRVVQRKYSGSYVVKHDVQSISVDSVLLKYKNGRLVQVCSAQDDSSSSCVGRSD